MISAPTALYSKRMSFCPRPGSMAKANSLSVLGLNTKERIAWEPGVKRGAWNLDVPVF